MSTCVLTRLMHFLLHRSDLYISNERIGKETKSGKLVFGRDDIKVFISVFIKNGNYFVQYAKPLIEIEDGRIILGQDTFNDENFDGVFVMDEMLHPQKIIPTESGLYKIYIELFTIFCTRHSNNIRDSI